MLASQFCFGVFFVFFNSLVERTSFGCNLSWQKRGHLRRALASICRSSPAVPAEIRPAGQNPGGVRRPSAPDSPEDEGWRGEGDDREGTGGVCVRGVGWGGAWAGGTETDKCKWWRWRLRKRQVKRKMRGGNWQIHNMCVCSEGARVRDSPRGCW